MGPAQQGQTDRNTKRASPQPCFKHKLVTTSSHLLRTGKLASGLPDAKHGSMNSHGIKMFNKQILDQAPGLEDINQHSLSQAPVCEGGDGSA